MPIDDPGILFHDDVRACEVCRHLNRDALTCDAFPDGIPGPILGGLDQHHDAFPGDGGIHFDPFPFRDSNTGRVSWSLVTAATDDGWRPIGALWLGDDGTLGFIVAHPEGASWRLDVRAAMKLGEATPAEYFAHWTTVDGGFAYAFGPVGHGVYTDVLDTVVPGWRGVAFATSADSEV